MPDFTVEDGWLSETAVRDLADWYHGVCPETPASSFEAHLMVLRAYVTLVEDSPLERVTGLSRPRYNILRMLYQEPDRRLLMSSFAHGMNVSQTNITKLVDALVADGLVRRAGDNLDKRRRWAELTPKGEELVERTFKPVAEHVSELWDGLEEREKQVLVHLLSKLRLTSMSIDSGTLSRTVSDYLPVA
jgi:DNA-binding MarR family transcriptional regulator